MTELGAEIVAAARTRLGAPFLHHFEPIDICQHGAMTVEHCIKQGMDQRGYDCSGLVIATICDVFDVQSSEWPWPFRHVKQLSAISTSAIPAPGDILLFNISSFTQAHAGIYVAEGKIIHASGILNHVLEEDRSDLFDTALVIGQAAISACVADLVQG